MTPPLLARGLVRRFGDLIAVDGLDLQADAGTCLALLGPNGAGKTTAIEMLEGLSRPDAGEISILGETWEQAAMKIREQIGVQLQTTELQEKITVQETLRLFRSFYREGGNWSEVLEIVGLEEKRTARVGTLSGGQKQRLALGCALVNKPRILFLDEPSTGLDPQARRRVWEIVEEFKHGGGTVLLTTHYMEEAERLADHVVIIDHGKTITEGSPDEIIAGLDAESILEFRLPANADGSLDDHLSLVEHLPGIASFNRIGDIVKLNVTDTQSALLALLERSRDADRPLDDIRTHRPTLEDVFVALTGRKIRDG